MEYKSVKIGSQIWMSENLNVEKFSNGDPILHAKTQEEWSAAARNKQPAWCYYDNDLQNSQKCGKIYNWYTLVDPRCLAPKGWKVPDNEEWHKLLNFLGTLSEGRIWLNAGDQMKVEGSEFWSPGLTRIEGQFVTANSSGTNSSGFSAISGGLRGEYGNFSTIKMHGYWGSISDYNEDMAYSIQLINTSSHAFKGTGKKGDGVSVRCIKSE